MSIKTPVKPMNRLAAIAVITMLMQIATASLVFAQVIEDHFLSVPDSSILGLSKEERRFILELHKTPNRKVLSKPLYAIEILDVKKGFLRLGGAMEGRLELCYWKMRSGKSLVAVYQEGCGPVCAVERFDFYSYDGRSYESVPINKVLPEIGNAFLKPPRAASLRELERRDIPATILYRLPRRGRDIVASFGDSAGKSELSGFAEGNRLTLVWRDGVFVKGALSWE